MANLRSKRQADQWCNQNLREERHTLSPDELLKRVLELFDDGRLVERMYSEKSTERQQKIAVAIFECVIHALKDVIRTTHVTDVMRVLGWNDENRFYVLRDLRAYAEEVEQYLQKKGVVWHHHARKALAGCIKRFNCTLEYVPKPAFQFDEVCSVITDLKLRVRAADREFDLLGVSHKTRIKTIMAILDEMMKQAMATNGNNDAQQAPIALLEDLRGREDGGAHNK